MENWFQLARAIDIICLHNSLIEALLPHPLQNSEVPLFQEVVSANDNKGVRGVIMATSDSFIRQKLSKVWLLFYKKLN